MINRKKWFLYLEKQNRFSLFSGKTKVTADFAEKTRSLNDKKYILLILKVRSLFSPWYGGYQLAYFRRNF